MSRDVPYSDDFEQMIADKIKAYWAAKGRFVQVWLEGQHHARYPRSNMLNGWPQDRAVEKRREAAE